jgi:hypothetical protein
MIFSLMLVMKEGSHLLMLTKIDIHRSWFSRVIFPYLQIFPMPNFFFARRGKFSAVDSLVKC